MGTYQVFTDGTRDLGGMMDRVDSKIPHRWLYHFGVEAIDAAGARVKKAGGEVLHGPNEVPGGSWTLHCHDAQGIEFALVALKR